MSQRNTQEVRKSPQLCSTVSPKNNRLRNRNTKVVPAGKAYKSCDATVALSNAHPGHCARFWFELSYFSSLKLESVRCTLVLRSTLFCAISSTPSTVATCLTPSLCRVSTLRSPEICAWVSVWFLYIFLCLQLYKRSVFCRSWQQRRHSHPPSHPPRDQPTPVFLQQATTHRMTCRRRTVKCAHLPECLSASVCLLA